MKFHEFVWDQVERLSVVPDFRMKEAGMTELADWLTEVSGGAINHEYPNTMAWVREYDGARRIRAVISECVEFEKPPGLSDVKMTWYRLFAPPNIHEHCSKCGGTGWVIVKRGEHEGAVKCTESKLVQ